MDCKFEVVISLAEAMPRGAWPMAERVIQRGLEQAARELKSAEGQCLSLTSIRLLEPTR